MPEEKEEGKRRFYWHANTSSGGTLSLSLDYEGEASKEQKEMLLATGIEAIVESMDRNGFIPHSARIMSSGDIKNAYGKTRQYWEKLLNEGKIHYKETSAGRITTNLWVDGYLNDRENVNKYVRDVRTVLETIDATERNRGRVQCPVCSEERFEFNKNGDDYINGICRNCQFYVHTMK